MGLRLAATLLSSAGARGSSTRGTGGGIKPAQKCDCLCLVNDVKTESRQIAGREIVADRAGGCVMGGRDGDYGVARLWTNGKPVLKQWRWDTCETCSA